MEKIINNKGIVALILCTICLLFMSVEVVNSATGLNVIMSSQNPDPVSPGNYVYVNIKVSNIGSNNLENVIINFNPNENFKLAQGEQNTRELGTLSSYGSYQNSNSFVVARYKLLVDSNTPLGLNKLKFDIRTSSGLFTYDFEVLVQDSKPELIISDISAQNVEPGKHTSLRMVLENKNNFNLKNVKVSLDLANVENKAINLNSGSNQILIDRIDPNQKKDIEFDISISPKSESIPYLLPIKISYRDNLDNIFENIIYTSIKVYSKPEISLTLDSQDVYSKGNGNFVLAIANPGTSQVKGVLMTILASDDYVMLEGENQYIGDLNPDDFQTLRGKIHIKNDKEVVLKVSLKYLDSYDNRSEQIIHVPFKTYGQEELKLLGYSKQSSSGGLTGYIIVMLITCILTFFFVRRMFRNRLNEKIKK